MTAPTVLGTASVDGDGIRTLDLFLLGEDAPDGSAVFATLALAVRDFDAAPQLPLLDRTPLLTVAGMRQLREHLDALITAAERYERLACAAGWFPVRDDPEETHPAPVPAYVEGYAIGGRR